MTIPMTIFKWLNAKKIVWYWQITVYIKIYFSIPTRAHQIELADFTLN